jgi:hypothetical protein
MKEPGNVCFSEGTLSKIVMLLDRLRELGECREIISDAGEASEDKLGACDAGLDSAGTVL